MSMLQSIMSYPNFVMKNSIMSQLVRLEEHFVQFEKMGGKLTDEMKSAVVLKCVSGPLKIHLNPLESQSQRVQHLCTNSIGHQGL